jgi:hypothetical protein
MTRETLEEFVVQECPTWATGTIVFNDELGSIVGYGSLKRLEDGSAAVRVTSAPCGAALLGEPAPVRVLLRRGVPRIAELPSA